MEIEDNIQWHPAFCSAMELELRDYKEYLRYEREHNLGKMPLEIDFLIIKKEPHVSIRNDIGDFFLGCNLFEYKSPGDEVNSGTFFKALAYACLYEAENRTAGNTLDTDITVSLVREQKPIQLLKQLGQKYTVTKKTDGIYRVDGTLFPLQILVTGELDKESHVWVTSLTKALNRERIERLLSCCYGLVDEDDKGNADSVLHVTAEANAELFVKMIQEGGKMSETLKKLLEPEITGLKIRIADQDTLITDMREQLTKQNAQLTKQNAQLTEQSARLTEQNAQLTKKNAQITEQNAQITKQKAQITDMGAEILKLRAMLTKTGVILDDKDGDASQ